ncbi:hypothetical protein PACILC2_11880 [Paenibacillus cisolokensis]|uniref:Uncharacterized protein n=1 Tax=Paenibacillus cisolokensis TaxID=1658519 RepID=A0ABQ4N386_9BACL|nr:hypothetical protein [Paenibacillus cisolokensis]GIQ62620.1 hypothetical protein PACILC2_11880 [Paenibacillus cisolokensis]
MGNNELYFSKRFIKEWYKGIVTWDNKTKTINVFNPNVHMLTRSIDTIFGEVNQNSRVTFNVFAQIDILKTDISAFKVTLTDPHGHETLIEERREGKKIFQIEGKRILDKQQIHNIQV